MDKSPEVMAALQAKLDVANERITQLTDEAWSFHHQELDVTIFSPFFFSGGLSTSLSAFNQHSNAASITEIDGFSMGSSDIWIHGTGEIRDSHAECNRFWLQP